MQFKNLDTDRAWDLILMYDDIYDGVFKCPDYDTLEAALYQALERGNFDIEHIMFSMVDFQALQCYFEQLKLVNEFTDFIEAN